MSAIVNHLRWPFDVTRGLWTEVVPTFEMESSMSGWKVTFLQEAAGD
jgi:hypothetical protein